MLKPRPTLILFLSLLITVLGISSCSLKKEVKKKKDSSFMANISTKYNILYNSKELLQQAQKNTNESTSDHYQQLLSIFREPNSTSIQQNKVLMDSVVGKTNRIIDDKQDSKYVGEAFLLKGEAYYHQADYFNANELFGYVANNTENPPKLKQEALLWQIRSLLQLGNLAEATKQLDLANTQTGENKHLKALSSATQAKYSLVNNNKTSAMAQLSQAIDYSPHKKDRLRWQFIIGQLLFERGENDLAYTYFSKVAKSNETYEMIFHTNLYRVEILNKANPTVENRVALLNKLLRDGKNKLYKGQIYQRIGDAYLLDKLIEPAITNYELATQNTQNAPYQQAINYQKLADLYFNEAKYTQSSNYYDSVIMVLPKEDPAYEQLSRKQEHLSSLVTQLTTIAYQDTLIQLAALSPEERDIFIEKSIAENTPMESVSKKKKGQRQRQASFTEANPEFASANKNNPGFYFNSAAAVSQGFSTFKKRWGNREAGNYWRYANQAPLPSGSTAEIAVLDQETNTIENEYTNPRERYLKNLPDTPDKLASAQNAIKEAYLALGDIYQYALMDKASTIKTYEDYLARFKSDENTALLCFHLHRLYVENSPEKAESYKARLLGEFPNSTYSLALNDPLYYQKQHDLLQQFNTDYNEAYSLFRSQDYLSLIGIADKIQQDNNFRPLEDNLAQLSYLRAIAIGRTAPIAAFQEALTSIIDNYPEEKIVVPLVKQHLTYIDSNKAQFLNKLVALDEPASGRTSFEKEFALTPWPELTYSKDYTIPVVRKNYAVNDGLTGLKINQTTQNKNALGIKNIEIGQISTIGHENSYRDITLFPDTATYYFVINVMHGNVNLSPSRYGLGQFNRGNYPASALNHQLKVINDESQLIYIGNFSTFAEAKAYEQKINPLLNSIMKIPADLYNGFIVTDAVFNTFANFDQIDNYNSLYQTQK